MNPLAIQFPSAGFNRSDLGWSGVVLVGSVSSAAFSQPALTHSNPCAVLSSSDVQYKGFHLGIKYMLADVLAIKLLELRRGDAIRLYREVGGVIQMQNH